jgi:hypothetical protein
VDSSVGLHPGMEALGQAYDPSLTVVAEGGAPVVVGANPSCWAMMAASTTWRSEGSMASGPPATGTYQTWVIIGVGPSGEVPAGQGLNPSILCV